MDHEVYGAIPVVVVDRLPPKQGVKDEMKAKLLDYLGSEYVLGDVYELKDLYMDEWPRNSSDKVLKSSLYEKVVSMRR